MNVANTLKLLGAFPLLYRSFEAPKSEHENCWIFRCADGWFELLWELSVAIEAAARSEGRTETDWPFAIKVNEKNGTLRFHLDNYSNTMWHLTIDADELSSQICEQCGAPGTIHHRTWLEALCVPCSQLPE